MRSRRALRLATRLALVLLATFLLVEGALRAVLFSSAFDGNALAARLREPALYADVRLEDLYWQLRAHFEERRGTRWYDERLGWTNGLVVPETHGHQEDGLVARRRPILLYGDSYAQCVTDDDAAFTALFERTELAREHYFLNYGVGGYGLDQVLLLLRASLAPYVERPIAERPIVLVGIFVDDDLDRCALSMRELPKPRLHVVDGALALEQPNVPSYRDYAAQHPPRALSFAWRLAVNASGLAEPTRLALLGLRDDDAEKRAVAAAILDEILRELETRGVDHMVVLFNDAAHVRDPALLGWREPLVRAALERHRTPVVDVAAALRERVARTGEELESFYGSEGPERGHYNALGNRMAFEAIAAGLTRSFGLAPACPFVSPRDIASTVLPAEQSLARYERGTNSRFPDSADHARLRIGVGAGGPTELHYELAGAARAFRARVAFFPEDSIASGSVRLTLLADGETVFERTLQRSDPPFELHVDVAGRAALAIRADDAGDGPAGDRIVLSAPRFE